jgi:5-aminopentanamidase
MAPRSLRVAAFELPARWAAQARALADVDALLARGPETDLVLLPEACLTGYVSPEMDADLRPFAEPLDGPTATALSALAKAHRTHLVGPLVLREGKRLYNAMLAVAPDGARVAVYRKRHPWYVETWATPGDLPLATFDVEGATLAMAICFDVHFLEEESARELGAADVLLFASAWVEREDSRPALLAGLARRFDLAVVNANWGHGEPRMWGQGGSRIVDRRGDPLAVAQGEGPQRVDARLVFSPARTLL